MKEVAMGYGVKVKVWGDLASFTRPEMKVERVSYDAMTPSAARGVLEAIYWKPQMRWVVDRIHVLAPIKFTQIRRNELSCKIPVRGKVGVATAMESSSGSLGIAVEDFRQQRAAMVLRDVCYGIDAHVEVLPFKEEDRPDSASEKPEAKHLDSFNRRAARGQCFHHPYLGCREFPASFELVTCFPTCPLELKGSRDLGYMLLDIDFILDATGSVVDGHDGKRLRAEPRFFRAAMVDGVITIPRLVQGRGSP
jgi:CRISPR-associated protein Cas5d